MHARPVKLIAVSGLIGVCVGATTAFAVATRYASRPFLHRSQKELQTAKYLLQKSTHDCGGHRATALLKIDDAISEVDLAVQYADAHPQDDSKH